jgi:hypothetical protein
MEIERLAIEIGLTYEYIDEKAEEVIEIAKEKKLDFKNPVLVCYDLNGPLTSTRDASLSPLPTVQRAMLVLKRIPKAILSGWDITSLRYFREKLGITELALIGEMGAVVEQSGRIVEIYPVAEEIHYEMKRRIYEKAAEEGLKIAIQGNVSTRVACIYFEADEEDRGNLRNHFLVKDTNVRTEDIFNALRKKENFRYNGEKIEFEITTENIKEIDYVLSKVFTLQSVRLEKVGQKIALWRDNKDNREFSLEDMIEFSKSAVPKGWKVDPNPDYCVDLVFEGDGVKLNKEKTANVFARKKFKSNEYIITNVGDKKADILMGENTLNFPQYGTEARRYCKKNGIPHVPVLHGGDYSLIIAELLQRLYGQ